MQNCIYFSSSFSNLCLFNGNNWIITDSVVTSQKVWPKHLPTGCFVYSCCLYAGLKWTASLSLCTFSIVSARHQAELVGWVTSYFLWKPWSPLHFSLCQFTLECQLNPKQQKHLLLSVTLTLNSRWFTLLQSDTWTFIKNPPPGSSSHQDLEILMQRWTLFLCELRVFCRDAGSQSESGVLRESQSVQWRLEALNHIHYRKSF